MINYDSLEKLLLILLKGLYIWHEQSKSYRNLNSETGTEWVLSDRDHIVKLSL